MITSLTTSLTRITLLWYIIGVLIIALGDPGIAEASYRKLLMYPWIPDIELGGLFTAANVQWHLLLYWTAPVLLLWAGSLAVSFIVTLIYLALSKKTRVERLSPSGEFCGVVVPGYSLGALPEATSPALTGAPVSLGPHRPGTAKVNLSGQLLEAVNVLTGPEKQLCEELLQLLYAEPNHFAGHGHGVGLLEHTLNVVTEAAVKCTPEFRLPLIAALAHDVGKLITFKPDGNGGWKRQGYHSRESARILATLPGFQQLPEIHRDALLLAVKYDHAPNKMPQLRSDREASMLAMRVITALSHADRSATAGEKERNLVKLKPEDLLWQDFVDFLREAPVVQRGKKGASNQVNNPPDSPYVYIYEAPWRDAAIPRMPAEVAAALDLTRRDPGKLAKYTRILTERLRKDGLLVEEHKDMAVSESNPLWDIQSGTGEKAVVLRGILVLKADALWKAVNYRISTKSPFPVQILAPNADSDGAVNDAPKANRETPKMPDVSDGLKLGDVDSSDAMASLGLVASPPADASSQADQPVATPNKPKSRGRFKGAAPSESDDVLGLASAPVKPAEPSAQEVAPAPALATPEEDTSAVVAGVGLEEAVEPLVPAEAPSEGGGLNMESLLQSALSALHEPAETPQPQAEEMDWVEPEADSPSMPEEASTALGQPEPAPAPAPAPAPEPAQASGTGEELSRAEKREGLAIADAAACALYPNLTLGDKYYTQHSRAVQAGLKKPGSRYKGDDKSKALELTSSGPRRARRKTS